MTGYVEGRGGRGTTPDPFVNGCVAKGLKELGRELGASSIFPFGGRGCCNCVLGSRCSTTALYIRVWNPHITQIYEIDSQGKLLKIKNK